MVRNRRLRPALLLLIGLLLVGACSDDGDEDSSHVPSPSVPGLDLSSGDTTEANGETGPPGTEALETEAESEPETDSTDPPVEMALPPLSEDVSGCSNDLEVLGEDGSSVAFGAAEVLFVQPPDGTTATLAISGSPFERAAGAPVFPAEAGEAAPEVNTVLIEFGLPQESFDEWVFRPAEDGGWGVQDILLVVGGGEASVRLPSVRITAADDEVICGTITPHDGLGVAGRWRAERS